MTGTSFPDGFPMTPLEAINYSYFLSDQDKVEWREWLSSATQEQQGDLVEILHSMWKDNQKAAIPQGFSTSKPVNSVNQNPPLQTPAPSIQPTHSTNQQPILPQPNPIQPTNNNFQPNNPPVPNNIQPIKTENIAPYVPVVNQQIPINSQEQLGVNNQNPNLNFNLNPTIPAINPIPNPALNTNQPAPSTTPPSATQNKINSNNSHNKINSQPNNVQNVQNLTKTEQGHKQENKTEENKIIDEKISLSNQSIVDIQREYLRLHQQEQNKFHDFIKKTAHLLDSLDSMNLNSGNVIDGMLDANNKISLHARKIQALENATQNRGSSLQDQIDDIKYDLDKLIKDFKDLRNDTRKRYDEISQQLAGMQAGIRAVETEF